MRKEEEEDSSSTGSTSSDEETAEQVRIVLKLADHCPNREYQIPDAPIAVPSDTTRKGLSKIVNHLLEKTNDDDIPFDFMISNKLLRMGIEREARRSGISLENAIVVTYFPAQPAPERTDESDKLPDWVGCLSASNNVLCAGCYDGSVQVYNIIDPRGGGFVKSSQDQLHSGPISALHVVDKVLVTGSMDHTLKVHNIIIIQKKNARIRTVAECVDGHAAAISSVQLHKNKVVSGDWDGQLCLWDIRSTAAEQQQQVQKKSKSDDQASASTKSIYAPESTLSAHASNISGLSWADDDSTIVSGSWDHSLKIWDVSRLETSNTYNCGRVIGCLDTQQQSCLVVTGHPDCSLKLWDSRNQDAVQTHTTLNKTSHKQWITDVQWSPTSSYHLASTSRDGTIKLWDIRSQLPLHTIRVSDEKALCLQYTEHSIFSGGTDCVVKCFQFPDTSRKKQ